MPAPNNRPTKHLIHSASDGFPEAAFDSEGRQHDMTLGIHKRDGDEHRA